MSFNVPRWRIYHLDVSKGPDKTLGKMYFWLQSENLQFIWLKSLNSIVFLLFFFRFFVWHIKSPAYLVRLSVILRVQSSVKSQWITAVCQEKRCFEFECIPVGKLRDTGSLFITWQLGHKAKAVDTGLCHTAHTHTHTQFTPVSKRRYHICLLSLKFNIQITVGSGQCLCVSPRSCLFLCGCILPYKTVQYPPADLLSIYNLWQALLCPPALLYTLQRSHCTVQLTGRILFKNLLR